MDRRDEMGAFGSCFQSFIEGCEASFDSEKMEISFFNEDEEKEMTLRVEYEVCSTCRGKGKHVNPSIDAHGISEDEFRDDPDFRREYMSGMYDVVCHECAGMRVVLEVSEKLSDSEALEYYNNWIQDEEDYRSMCEMERRMGA